jgi:hypothetical protein
MGIPVFTSADFGWMAELPELSFPFRTYAHCMVAKGGTMLYASTGSPIPEASHLRGKVSYLAPSEEGSRSVSAGDVGFRLDEVVFIPFLQLDHFGHFLTESVSWLAALLDPFLEGFIRSGQAPTLLLGHFASREGYKERLSERFSIPMNNILSTAELPGLTQLDRVYVPERTMINRSYFSVRHFAALRGIVDRWYGIRAAGLSGVGDVAQRRGTARKGHLSRVMLPPGYRHLHGEAQIEQHLKVHGWEVVHPERMTVHDQIETLRDADVISGNPGSAFHLLMYFGLDAGPKCEITLGGRNEFLALTPSGNVFSQLKLQQFDCHHLAAFAAPSPYSKVCDQVRSMDLEILYPPVDVAEAMESIARRFLGGGSSSPAVAGHVGAGGC